MTDKQIYQFEDFYLDSGTHSFYFQKEEIKLEPRVFDVLHLMLLRPNELISKDEFFEYVWQEKVVSDWALSRAIKVLRKTLLEKKPREMIKTLYGKGYLFTSEVKVLDHSTFKEITSSLPVIEEENEQSYQNNSENISDQEPMIETNNEELNASDDGHSKEKRAHYIKLIALTLFSLLVIILIYRFNQAPKIVDNARIKSIVVLPITNISGSEENEYLASGLTDVIIGQLAQESSLKVISKTSAIYYKNKQMTTRAIAKELNVEAVLEGSIFPNQDQINLNLRLINGDSEALIWSVNQQKSINEVHTFFQAAAQNVVDRIGGKTVTESTQTELPYERAGQESFKLYLRAIYLFKTREKASMLEAEKLLLEAIQYDNEFSEAYSALASVYVQLSSYSINRDLDRFVLAKNAVNIALELKPESSQAWATLGLILFGYDYDFNAAEGAYKKSIKLDPGNISAKQAYAEFLAVTGREELALGILESAWKDDPFNRLLISIWGSVLMIKGDYEQALDKFKLAESIGEKLIWLDRDIAYTHQYLGDIEKTVQIRLNQMQEVGYSELEINQLKELISVNGIKGFWQWRIPHLLEKWQAGVINPSRIAEAYAGVGDYKKMLFWFKKGMEPKGEYWIQLVKRSPVFRPFKNEPDFKALLSSYGISI